jgi:biotin operon repressor
LSTSYCDVCVDVNYISPTQHKFYKSSYDLLGLLIWFQRQSKGCFASTEWLAKKLDITTRAVLKTLRKLEDAGLILRTKDGKRRIITCLIEHLPQPNRSKPKRKSSPVPQSKVHPSILNRRTEIHNSKQDVDVLVNALEEEGIKPIVARSLAKRYSKQQIRAVINACRKDSSIKSKAAWIVSGLSKGWNVGSSVDEPPKYQLFQRPQQAPDRSGYKDGIAMIRERLGIVRR